MSHIDPQEEHAGLFVCALQPNGLAEKDGRLQIDDRLLAIDDRNVDELKYREVVQTLRDSTKKGVTLTIAR